MPSRDRRTWIWLLVLAIGTVVAVSHGRKVRRAHASAHFAARTVSTVGATEACLLKRGGSAALTLDNVSARARVLALGDSPTDWPARCVSTLDEVSRGPPRAADPETEARIVADTANTLRDALSRRDAADAVKAFRDGHASWRTPAWAGPLVLYVHAVAALGHRHGLALPSVAPPRSVPHTLPSLAADVLPLPLHHGAQVAGWNFAAGTLAIEFIDPSLRRLFCRSRDRGASIQCHWLAPEGGVAITLVGDDRPEALTLVNRAGVADVESVDALGTQIFPLGATISRSLACRVDRDTLFAMVDTPAGPALERVARGGARMAREPAGVTQGAEAVMLAPDAAVEGSGDLPGAWWVASDTDHDAQVLVARRLPVNLDAPVGERLRVAAVHSPTALLYGCQAAGVGYVAVVDAPGGTVVALDGTAAPRVLGTLEQIDLPASVVCDATGATVVGASWVQSCSRTAGCSARWRDTGVRGYARMNGTLIEVQGATGGGLRMRSGPPGQIATKTMVPIADDAAHGGVDARSMWLFPADDRLVLVSLGETNAVLWSDDQGGHWHPSRETGEVQ